MSTFYLGRGDGIRTHDLMVPNHARYQTALHLGKKNDTTFAFSFQLFCDKYSRKLRYAYVYGNFNDRKAVIIGKKFEYYKKR